MPDIAMCQNERCPSRTTCKRNAASGTIPDAHYQSYHDFLHSHSTGKCGDYWPVKNKHSGVEK